MRTRDRMHLSNKRQAFLLELYSVLPIYYNILDDETKRGKKRDSTGAKSNDEASFVSPKAANTCLITVDVY